VQKLILNTAALAENRNLIIRQPLFHSPQLADNLEIFLNSQMPLQSSDKWQCMKQHLAKTLYKCSLFGQFPQKVSKVKFLKFRQIQQYEVQSKEYKNAKDHNRPTLSGCAVTMWCSDWTQRPSSDILVTSLHLNVLPSAYNMNCYSHGR